MPDKQAKNSEHPNLNVGRKAGAVNKATSQAREAIARFVDGNAPSMQKWLEQVADALKTMMINTLFCLILKRLLVCCKASWNITYLS